LIGVGEQLERSRLKLRQLQGQLRGKTTMAISKQQTLPWRMLKEMLHILLVKRSGFLMENSTMCRKRDEVGLDN
jgi:hypothetical protein